MSQVRIKELGMNRIARPRWNIYDPDGLGRDTYISYNNGGFWSMKMPKKLNPPDDCYVPKYHTLFHRPAPFKYLCDGSGRDNYIIINDGGLRDDFRSLKSYKLQEYLRNENQKKCLMNNINATIKLSKKELKNQLNIKNIEKGLISRLYNPFMEKITDLKELKKNKSMPKKNLTIITDNNNIDFDNSNNFKAKHLSQNSKTDKSNLIRYYTQSDADEEIGPIPGLRFYPSDRIKIPSITQKLRTEINFYKPYKIPIVALPKPTFKKKSLSINFKKNYNSAGDFNNYNTCGNIKFGKSDKKDNYYRTYRFCYTNENERKENEKNEELDTIKANKLLNTVSS